MNALFVWLQVMLVVINSAIFMYTPSFVTALSLLIVVLTFTLSLLVYHGVFE